MSYYSGQFLLLTRPTVPATLGGLRAVAGLWRNDGPGNGQACLFPSQQAAVTWAKETYPNNTVEVSVVKLPDNPHLLVSPLTKKTICNLSSGDLFQFPGRPEVHEVLNAGEFRYRTIGIRDNDVFRWRPIPGRSLVDWRHRKVVPRTKMDLFRRSNQVESV